MYQLFLTSRPSRAHRVAVSTSETAFKKESERAWAESLGLDLRKITASTTETPGQPFDTTSPSTVGTPTENGADIHADVETDHTEDEGANDYSTDP